MIQGPLLARPAFCLHLFQFCFDPKVYDLFVKGLLDHCIQKIVAFASVRKLLIWYALEFERCMQSEIDCTLNKTKGLLESDALSVVYWDHKQENATTPNLFLPPPCSLERFNERDNDLFKDKKHNIEEHRAIGLMLVYIVWSR